MAPAMFSLGWAGLYVGGGLLMTAAVLVFANRLYGEDQVTGRSARRWPRSSVRCGRCW